jgi:maleate isomerase
VAKLEARCSELAAHLGIPVCNASIATQQGLRQIGAKRIAVLTPFNAEIDQVVKANIESGGFEVVAIRGSEAPSLPAICETPLQRIRELIAELARSDCDAIAQVGTALPVVGLLDELEQETGKTIVACNAAVYWQTLRAAGIGDALPGYGRLLREA